MQIQHQKTPRTHLSSSRQPFILSHIKDPGSAITHFIGMLMALLALPPLIIKAANGANHQHIFSFITFIVTMILLYGASTTYHSFNLSKEKNERLKKFDHSMIFIMIAGSYTPVCTIVLQKPIGTLLLSIVWSIAILGIILKFFFIHAPKWLSSTIYIAMGWTCVLAFQPIYYGLTSYQFGLLLAGGIIYTIGGIIYALKLPIFNSRHKNFGSHEIFHIFVMVGSVCHFLLVYSLV